MQIAMNILQKIFLKKTFNKNAEFLETIINVSNYRKDIPVLDITINILRKMMYKDFTQSQYLKDMLIKVFFNQKYLEQFVALETLQVKSEEVNADNIEQFLNQSKQNLLEKLKLLNNCNELKITNRDILSKFDSASKNLINEIEYPNCSIDIEESNMQIWDWNLNHESRIPFNTKTDISDNYNRKKTYPKRGKSFH